MVKIRYTELPAGLHVSAEKHGRHTIIYLLPGLPPAPRRAALIRVRSSARMGHGPSLPAVSMVAALGADRLRTTVSNGAAAMRGHPLLLLPPLVVLVSGAIVFLLMSFVTLTVRQHDQAGAPSSPPARVLTTPRNRIHPDPDPPPSSQVGHPGFTGTDPGGHHKAGTSPAPSSSSPGSATSSPSGTPTPTLTPSPSSSPSPSPSPSPSASQSQTCVKLGPLGLCVSL
jgi:hypothetical protein